MGAAEQLGISTESVITGSAAPTLARRNQLDHAGHLRITGEHTSGISVAINRRDTAGMGLSLPTPVADAYLAIVQFRTIGPTLCKKEGKPALLGNLEANKLQIVDMRDSWTVDLRQPFHSLDFFLTKQAIEAFARDAGGRGSPELFGSMVEQAEDSMMANFASIIAPAVERPHEANALFFAHLFSAVRIHLVRRHGSLTFSTPRGDGKLAAWQERRALDILRNDLGNDITIEEVAAECGLSPSHFARAFKVSSGMAPHQWRLAFRIERAKQMLESTDQPISAVALACGFADQSHLTRIFSKAVGSGPGAWRRAQKK